MPQLDTNWSSKSACTNLIGTAELRIDLQEDHMAFIRLQVLGQYELSRDAVDSVPQELDATSSLGVCLN